MLEQTINRDQKKWLEQGPLTKIGPTIKKLARDLPKKKDLDLLFEIFQLVKKLVARREPSSELLNQYHQKRSAEEILNDGWGISCSDAGVVFCTLARACRVPTQYIQTVNLPSYRAKPKSPHGHVFCLCFLNGGRYLIDPTRGCLWKLDKDFTSLSLKNQKGLYVLAFKGLDNQDCGVKNHQDLLIALASAAKKWLRLHQRSK